MLVHAKSPRGVLHLKGYRIYGKETGRNPVDIPFELYNSSRDSFRDATYREEYISKKFGVECPEIAFTYSELKWLPDKTLDVLGKLIVPKYLKKWSHKKKVDQIKVVLREASPQ